MGSSLKEIVAGGHPVDSEPRFSSPGQKPSRPSLQGLSDF